MSRPSPTRLVVADLSFDLPDGRPLLHHITFSLTDERVGLVGPNGAGKSTLLRLLAGLESPVRGRVRADPSLCYLPQRTTVSTAQSGGEAARAAIASALHDEPRVLLLDEPSNHLDTDGRRWLTGLVRRWPFALLVATHDRALLSHVDRIIELRQGTTRLFGGAWPAFEAERNAEAQRITQAVASAESVLRRTQRAVRAMQERKARSDARGRRSRDTGSQPSLVLNAQRERAQDSGGRLRETVARRIDVASGSLREARAALDERVGVRLEVPIGYVPTTKLVVALERVRLAYEDCTVLTDVTLSMRGPERIAITGPNGAGKSTLLRAIAGRHPVADGAVQRAIPLSRSVWVDQGTVAPDRPSTLIEHVVAQQPTFTVEAARALLASAGFRGDTSHRTTDTLSGGERVRLALATAFATPEPPEVLLLDEPTNHLDHEAVALLEQVVHDFTGAVILVSHDEHFRQAVGITREVDVSRWRADHRRS